MVKNLSTANNDRDEQHRQDFAGAHSFFITGRIVSLRCRLFSALSLLCLCVTTFSFSQTGTVNGTCSLPDTSAWNGITICVDGQEISTLTDIAGNFTLTNVHTGPVTIKAGKLYYRNADTTISLTAGAVVSVTLALTGSITDTFSALQTGKFTSASTNSGNIGVPDKFVEPGDSGFAWNGIQQLKEASFMIGIDSTRVSDAARFIFGMNQDNLDRDFLSLSDIVTLASGPDSTVQVTAFDDSKSNGTPGTPSRPLGVSIIQQTTVYGGLGDNGYMIVRMDIRNDSRFTLNNLLPGWFIDWQAGGTPNTNRGGIITAIQQTPGANSGFAFPVEIAYQKASSSAGPFMGIVPLSQAKFRAARIASIANEILPTAPNGGLTEANKYNYMKQRRAVSPNGDRDIEEDLCTIVSLGGLGGGDYQSSAFTLHPGDVIEIGFAFAGGSDSVEFVANALNAQRKWITEGNTMTVYPNTWGAAAGWNLISLPVVPADRIKTDLFPSAISSAYAYNKLTGYTRADTLAPGPGYWLKFPTPANIGIDGTPILNDTLNVGAGWNIIGALTYPVTTAAISTIPANIITGSIYGYNGTYFTTSTLQPFKAYWVKISQLGQLIITGGK